MKKLFVEAGVDTFLDKIPEDRADWQKFFGLIERTRYWASCIDIDITFSPYQSCDDSVFNLGNRNGSSLEKTKEMIQVINEAKTPFTLAMNGGFSFRETEIDLSHPDFRRERDLLDTLAEKGAQHNQKNAVVITHDKLLADIKQLYPDLETIASTIRFNINRKNAEALYEDAFQSFDRVVPANVDILYRSKDFIDTFSKYRAKILPFLNLQCGSVGNACTQHYLHGEMGTMDSFVQNKDYPYYRNSDIALSLLNRVHFKLQNIPQGGVCHESESAMLINHPEILTSLIQSGISSFKIARGPKYENGLIEPVLDNLLPIFAEHAISS